MSKLKIENSTLDLDKLCYDLALIYAKTKYEDELRKDCLPIEHKAPDFIEESDYLLTLFSQAYSEYLSYDEDYFKEKFFIED